MAVETFEQVLALAQADGGLNRAFTKFLKTTFFVPVQRAAGEPQVRLALHAPAGAAPGARPALLVSEDAARLDASHGNANVLLTGADIVTRIQADADIMVAVSADVFHIARDRVEWLKKGVAAAYARAEAQKATQARADLAPPAAAVAPAEVIKPAVPPAPVRRQVDVAALNPASVSLPRLGVELFVPGSWVETRNTRSVFYIDPDSSTKVELSSTAKPFMPLAEWQAMRLAQVGEDMPFLTLDGAPVPLEGSEWRDSIKGTATEFTGVFPGEDVESRYLVACLWLSGRVMSIAIRARSADFERLRDVYRWMLSRVAPAPELAAAEAGLPFARASEMDGDMETYDPPLFSISPEGRIGRVRALAYATCVTFPCAIAMGLGGLISTKAMVLGAILMIAAGMVAMAFSARLMVLRLHDLNMSGKLAIPLFAATIMASLTGNPTIMAVVSVIFWLVVVALFYVLPGTEGENHYGPPTSPETTAMKVLAGVFLLINAYSIYAQVTTMRAGPQRISEAERRIIEMDGGPSIPKVETPLAAMRPLVPADGSFSVDLPGEAREVPRSWYSFVQRDEGVMLQYELEAGGRLYVVQSVTYKKEPGDAFPLLEAAQKHLTQGDNVVLSAQPFGIDGHTGRDLRIRMRDGKVKASRIVFFGKRAAVISVTVPELEADAPGVNEFLYSLKLLK